MKLNERQRKIIETLGKTSEKFFLIGGVVVVVYLLITYVF